MLDTLNFFGIEDKNTFLLCIWGPLKDAEK